MGVLDGWKFCARCAASLTWDADHFVCDGCGELYWANSLPGVQGILVRDGKVLLGKRAHEPRKGWWDLPGGFLGETERPEDGLRREFLEETGIHVEPLELMRIDVEPYHHRHVLAVTYVVQGEGEPVAADDVAELRWFAPDEIPEMAFPAQNDVLRVWVARQEHA